ncbi:MAG: hypothetical protein ABI076_06490 [Acidobacteriaceae bacterium]
MTAECFADLVGARPIGRGRWQARCPAHDDRNPSLTITQGRKAVLLECWSHRCTPQQITAVLGLRMADLFAGPPVTPQQAAALAAQHNARATIERQQRAADRAARDRAWKLECVRDALGAKLARSPDDAELARLFHLTCVRSHDVETALFPIAPELGGKRMEPPGEVPSRIGAALTDIGEDLQPQTTATRSERAAQEFFNE